MSKKKTEKTNKTNRNKLITKFWLIAKSIGEDHAYDVVESLYNHRSLRILTMAELDRVVRELQEKSGYKFKPKAQPKPQRFFVLPRGFFENLGLTADISTPLKKKIQVMTKEAGISIGTLTNLVKKMASPNGYFGIVQAQKVIEALKNMRNTGWKETGTPQKKPGKPGNVKSSPGKKKVKPFLEDPERLVYDAKTETTYSLMLHWWSEQEGHA